MKFDGYSYIVRVEVLFTMEELEALEWMADHHYDRTCRDLAGEEGIIATMLMTQSQDDDAGLDTTPWALTIRHVDIMCKIFEGVHLDDRYVKPGVIQELRGKLIKLVHMINGESARLMVEEARRPKGELNDFLDSL